MELRNDSLPVTWRRTGLLWVLSCVAGYGAASVIPILMAITGAYTFLIDLPSGFSFWGRWGTLGALSLLTGLISLMPIVFGAIISSLFQSLTLRQHLTNSFRWLKFTVLGAVVGSVVWVVLISVVPLVAFYIVCSSIDCGYEQGPAGYMVLIQSIVSIVAIVALCLAIAIGQGLVWRSLGLPFAPWCLVSSGAQLLDVLPPIFLFAFFPLSSLASPSGRLGI